MPTKEWITAPKKKSAPREHALVTPERSKQATMQGNQLQILEEITIKDLTHNTVTRCILSTSNKEPHKPIRDSNSESEMNARDKKHETTYEDLIAQLELTTPGLTNKVTEKLNLAHVVWFREEFGTVLGTIPSLCYNWGHS